MESSTLSIPVRSSSKLPLDKQRIHLKESRAELKRKLSEVSFEEQPIEYRKLRIQDLEAQVEEHRINKSWIDQEHQQQQLDDNASRKEHRETNKRILSLGGELWKENEQLRMQEEKDGKVPKLGPDSKGAFVHTLLALYKDPNTSHKRSSSLQSQMKETAIAVYEASKGAPFKGKIWCCITQDYFDKIDVKAAHIIPYSLGPELVDYIFGSGSGSRLNSSDNCLLMHNTAERAFDNGNFVLIPVDASETPILRWRIQMTNLAAVHTGMGRKTLNDYDGKEITFKNDSRPASRFLYYHFIVTLLRNKKNRQPGWQKFSTELPTGKPFATMGRYMRESMLLTLAKSAGDLNPAEEARLLGGDGGETFVEKERLTEREETEVARRVFEAHEVEDEEDQEDDGKDD